MVFLNVKSIIKRAKKWGMSSIAVTDHGCVQAFPDAIMLWIKEIPFKILYGVEGYLVDDTEQLVEKFLKARLLQILMLFLILRPRVLVL